MVVSYVTTGFIQPPKANTPHGRHASVVVGRKEFAGRCHYLIKNSWGAQWTPGNINNRAPSLLKELRTGKKQVVGGYFWFNSDEFMESTGDTRRLFGLEAIDSRKWYCTSVEGCRASSP